MSKLLDRIERLLTGYTAEERADIQRRYIDWRVEQVLAASFERLIAEDDDETEASEDQPQNEQEEGNA